METLRFTASISILAFASGTICWFQLGKAGHLHRPVVFIGDDSHRRILNSWKFHLAVRHLFGGQSFQQSVRGLKSAMEALTVLFGSYFAPKTHWFCTFTRENEPSVPSDSHFQLDNSVVFAQGADRKNWWERSWAKFRLFSLTNSYLCHVTFTLICFIAAPLCLGYTHQLLQTTPAPIRLSNLSRKNNPLMLTGDRGRTAPKTIAYGKISDTS